MLLKNLVTVLIVSRLDYCNSVQNQATAACIDLVFNLRLDDHVSECLTQLHWFPARSWVEVELCMQLMFYTMACIQLPALRDGDDEPPKIAAPRRSGPHSADTSDDEFVIPRQLNLSLASERFGVPGSASSQFLSWRYSSG
jgi:hypothetical protein